MLARLLALAIAMVVGGLGLVALVEGYVPERMTRFGVAGPFFAQQARDIAVSMLLLACLPLIMWAPSRRHAAIWGTVLGLALVTWIFLSIYLIR